MFWSSSGIIAQLELQVSELYKDDVIIAHGLCLTMPDMYVCTLEVEVHVNAMYE